MKDFDVWLAALGFDPATLSDKGKQTLEAQWRAELGGAGVTPSTPAPPAKAPATFSETSANIQAESERCEAIHRLGAEAMTKFAKLGQTRKVEQIRELMEAAITDEGTSVRDFKHELILQGRADTVSTFSRGENEAATAKMVEAAVCRRGGLGDLEKHFDAQTLEISERQFKRGLSLVGLLAHSAQRNGWRGQADAESKDFLRAAFGTNGDGVIDMRAGTTGPSTYSLPNIVGNVANKFLKSGFLSVDSAWQRLCYRRSVNDFKTITTARLNGALIYRTLGTGGGEIKHGTVSESTFTNRASTYAIMLGINREDLINDDLGAFTELSRHMGRGAGLKINDVFWTVFLNNSSFFTSGNNNVSTGGGSALGSADGGAINLAEIKFIAQTDANGYPIALAPRIMLAPPTLANTARRWMGSFGFLPTGTTGLGDSNIFQGRYDVVTSPYMENASYTGQSNAAWYLLADPMDEAVIEGVALNNRWEPTVDTAEPDFNQLGIAMRGYIDIGFAFKEPRAGVRSAGS